MRGCPSGFKTDAAREEYVRYYDRAIAQSQVPISESDIETSFGTTHVMTSGDEAQRPLVALHGLQMSSTMWIPVLSTLTASHHVRMLDTVGDLNKSRATAVLSSPARVVAWIDEALDALGIEQAAFVGLSIGSWMAAHYAMARPERVERLALLAPVGVVSRQHVKWLASMSFALRIAPTEARVERALATTVMPRSVTRLRTDPWAPITQQFITGTTGFRFNLREARPIPCDLGRLGANALPVLAVIPRDETAHDGATMAERFRQRLPRAQVKLVDDANHLIVVDQPEVVAELLRNFLGGR